MSYPTKIKAVGINETGSVDVIQNLELPFPDVKPTDLLVKVHHLSMSSIYDEVRGSILSRRLNGLVSTSSIPISGNARGIWINDVGSYLTTGLVYIRADNALSLLPQKYLESSWSCPLTRLFSRTQTSRVEASRKGATLPS
jgi:hypothetical protein